MSSLPAFVQNLFELAVTDSGTGMDEATRPRIFEPFSQRRSGKHRPGASTLRIMHQVALLSKYGSRVGEGTTFSVYLHCRRRSGPEETRTPCPPRAWRDRLLIRTIRARRSSKRCSRRETTGSSRRLAERSVWRSCGHPGPIHLFSPRRHAGSIGRQIAIASP